MVGSQSENGPFILQCVRLGMLLENPDDLDNVDEMHFADPQIRDIVVELKERRQRIASKQKVENGVEQLRDLLTRCGCDYGFASVEEAKSAIRDRVEVDGRFTWALWELSKIVRVQVDQPMTSEQKRAFTNAVTSRK